MALDEEEEEGAKVLGQLRGGEGDILPCNCHSDQDEYMR